MKQTTVALAAIFFSFASLFAETNGNEVMPFAPESQSSSVINPLWTDLPDPDVIHVGDYYYLVTTTMHLMPGAPIMRSKDLAHWETISYLFNKLEDTPKYDMQDGTVYGRGQWATSLRYHKGLFYAFFSPNDAPFRSYVMTSPDAITWTLHSRMKHFHDASLFFDDDDRVYIFSGTGSLTELNADLTDVKEGGVNVQLNVRDAEETGLLEGSRVIKHDGKYYLLMISWPKTGRQQLAYRADKITGPYEKKVILKDGFAGFPLVGQGTIVDDGNDNWYGVIFQDRGAVGRVLTVSPCTWKEGWPMLGDAQGHVPAFIPQVGDVKNNEPSHFVFSDEFGTPVKPSVYGIEHFWQWNHNPVEGAWSLTERDGYLRLHTSRLAQNLYMAPNTLSQRMEGPACSAIIKMDIRGMKDGDRAGLAAFNGHSGVLTVSCEGKKHFLSMSEQTVNFDRSKAVRDVDVKEQARVDLGKAKTVYLKINGDFTLGKDLANFFYSTNGKDWKEIGQAFKMRFDFQRLFMGTRYAIFNYATQQAGGSVDVDYFHYELLNAAK